MATLALAFAYRPLLVGYARCFTVDDAGASDALVVLTGGWFCRPLRAAELYHHGLAPKILLPTSAPIPYPDLNETTLNREVLIHSAVRPDAIELLPGVVTSTREEAKRVVDYVKRNPVRRITVVTTAFHTTRARWIFQKELRETGVEIRMAAAKDPRFNESNWYHRTMGRAAYIQEALKCAYYRLVY